MRSCTRCLGSFRPHCPDRWALEGQTRGQARVRPHGHERETSYKRACAGSRTSRPNRAHICLNDGFDVINHGQSNPGRERLGSVVMGRRCRDRLQLRFPHGRELEWADSDSSSFRPEREDFFQVAAAVAERANTSPQGRPIEGDSMRRRRPPVAAQSRPGQCASQEMGACAAQLRGGRRS